MLSDFFRCPRSGQKLMQIDQTAVSQDRRHIYEFVNGVPDFYIEEDESVVPADDANRKWLDADAVSARDLYYDRCSEWEGMSYCVDQIARLSHPTCRVLEVGAGTGHFSRRLAESCESGTLIYCFDFSLPCLRTIETRTAGFPNVHLFRANARGPMPFAPGGFDVILQRLAPFAPKGVGPQTKFQRALDLLKPGGHYVFAGWEDEYNASCDLYLQNGFARVRHHRWAYPYHFGDEEFVGGLVEGGATREEADAQLSDAKGAPDGLLTLRKEHLFIAQKPQ